MIWVVFDRKVDIWLIRFIVLNGIGFFATWLTLATNLNLAQFLAYATGMDYTLASTIALIIILVVFVFYSLMENVFWPKYLLYLFTPWIVVNIALIGSVSGNWVGGSRNNIISLIMLIVVLFLGIVKVVMFVLYKTVLKKRIRPYARNQVDQEPRAQANDPVMIETETSRDPIITKP